MSGLTLMDVATSSRLQRGVIETIARESGVLESLPFLRINGNALSYIGETKMATVSFRDINKQYQGSNGQTKQVTEPLKLLGGIVKVDRFLEYTQNIYDVRAEATASKSKSIANTFTDTFFNGDTSLNSLEFNGINKRMEASQIVDGEGYNLVPGMLLELMDRVQKGANIIYMNKRTRRKLTSLLMKQTAFIETGQDAFGRLQHRFGGVPIAVVEDQYIPNDAIYAVRLGQGGVMGIHSGPVSTMDNGLRGNFYETLLEWYTSIVVMNPKGISVLKNFTL